MSDEDISVDTLSKFSQNFQVKCINALLSDRQFTEQVVDVVNPKFFEAESNQWIVDRILWYFQNYRTLPTLEVFKKELDKVQYDVLKSAVTEQLRAVYRAENRNAEDMKYVKDEFLAFCKNQAIKVAIIQSVDLLERGNYDTIKSVIDKAMNAGQERNIGHIYMEELEIRTSKVARNVVPSPWECINELIDGGLGAGEIGCIICSSGGGKSWALTCIGAHAMRLGKTVAHYTLELSETYLGLRYDTVFTGIEPNHIRDNEAKVKSIMEQIPGKLFIKYFPAHGCTVNTLRAHTQRLQNTGNAPDLIIIDYPDLMRSITTSSARHEELTFIHEEIRGFLGEMKLPGWVASQAGRSALQDDIIEADKIAGAYGKIMTDDLVISASRKMADKLTNTGRGHMIKNRFGPDGMTFPMNVDLAHGKFDFYNERSPQGIMLKNKMASGEGNLRQLMAQKFVDTAKVDDV